MIKIIGAMHGGKSNKTEMVQEPPSKFLGDVR